MGSDKIKMVDTRIKEYWDDKKTESMYDKNLLDIETQAIIEQLNKNDDVIDIGCGEGEATIKYLKKVKSLLAVDYSTTRLSLLKQKSNNIDTLLLDMRKISPAILNRDYDVAITQRSLINLASFNDQKLSIRNIHSILKDNGRYIMLEGFLDGAKALNAIRKDFKLPEIPIKWHNCYLHKQRLLKYMNRYFTLEHSRDFSLYFFLTRALNAILQHPKTPEWDSRLNCIAKEMELKYNNQFIKGVSRLELMVFKKRRYKNK
jgi:ubiquinone/menaquinone biosynthesis C-methylase UbiE